MNSTYILNFLLAFALGFGLVILVAISYKLIYGLTLDAKCDFTIFIAFILSSVIFLVLNKLGFNKGC